MHVYKIKNGYLPSFLQISFLCFFSILFSTVSAKEFDLSSATLWADGEGVETEIRCLENEKLVSYGCIDTAEDCTVLFPENPEAITKILKSVSKHNKSEKKSRQTLTLAASRTSFAEQCLPPKDDSEHLIICLQLMNKIEDLTYQISDIPTGDQPKECLLKMEPGVTFGMATEWLKDTYKGYYQPRDVPSCSHISVVGPFASFSFSRLSFHSGSFFPTTVEAFTFLPAKAVSPADVIECKPEDELFYQIPGLLGAAGVVTSITLRFYLIPRGSEVQTKVLARCHDAQSFTGTFTGILPANRNKYDQGIYALSHGRGDNQDYVIIGSKMGKRTDEPAETPTDDWHKWSMCEKFTYYLKTKCCRKKFTCSEDPEFTFCSSHLPLYDNYDPVKGVIIRLGETFHEWSFFPRLALSCFQEGALYIDDPRRFTYYHDGFRYMFENLRPSTILHHAWILHDPARLTELSSAVEEFKRNHKLCSLLEDYTPVKGTDKFPMAPTDSETAIIYQFSDVMHDGNKQALMDFCEELTDKIAVLGGSPLLLKELYASDDVLRRTQIKDKAQHIKEMKERYDPNQLLQTRLLKRLERLVDE